MLKLGSRYFGPLAAVVITVCLCARADDLNGFRNRASGQGGGAAALAEPAIFYLPPFAQPAAGLRNSSDGMNGNPNFRLSHRTRIELTQKRVLSG